MNRCLISLFIMSVQNTKLTNKANRKVKKCLDSLIRDIEKNNSDFDIRKVLTFSCDSGNPTKNIFVGNAGLTTGVDEEHLAQLFSSVSPGLHSVMVIPGKQYSFVSFSKTQDASVAYEAIHGQLGIKNGSSMPLYLAFVDQVPSMYCAIEYTNPPGLILKEDFISSNEEEIFLNLINWEEILQETSQVSLNKSGSSLKHRQVHHFGYEFRYDLNSVDSHCPLPQKIPDQLSPLVDKIMTLGLMSQRPDQLTVNRYLPGQGIPPHIDTHSAFTDEIVSLSLGGNIAMDFRKITSGNTGSHCVVYLVARSLCVMTGEVRYEWSHGICPRMTDVIPSAEGLKLLPRQERLSFTFRALRSSGVCYCNGPSTVCDSQKEKAIPKPTGQLVTKNRKILDDDDAFKLERNHVIAIYEQIADHFSITRHKPWPRILKFVSEMSVGSTLLDVGCGNGKYLTSNSRSFQLGCDSSFKLGDICRSRGFQFANCSCLKLPFRNASFDAVICIAVVHHLANEARRLSALKEISRVLAHNGRALVYVWALEQRHKEKNSSYLRQGRRNRKGLTMEEDITKFAGKKLEENLMETLLPVHENGTDFCEQDMLVPWKLNSKRVKQSEQTVQTNSADSNDIINCQQAAQPVVYHRYYHLFRNGEIESLCSCLDIKLIDSYYDEGNWCVLFKKC